ncbi:MAG: hypothetical protein ACRELB_18375 [Polyangiaceae bacterium]
MDFRDVDYLPVSVLNYAVRRSLSSHRPVTSTRSKPRRHRPELGDIFAVPLEDGYFGVTQIGAMGADVPTYVVFDAHLPSVEDVGKSSEDTLKKPVATVFIAGENKARSGQWPFVGNRPPAFAFPVPAYEHKRGATSSSDHAWVSSPIPLQGRG